MNQHLTRILCIALAAFLLLGIAACSGADKDSAPVAPAATANPNSAVNPGSTSNSNSAGDSDNNPAPSEPYLLFQNEDSDAISLETPDQPLDVDAIFENLEYTPDMLYGSYYLADGSSALDSYLDNAQFMLYEEEGLSYTEGREITTVPYKLEIGPDNMNFVLSYDRAHYYLEAFFLSSDGDLVSVNCAYIIENGKLVLFPVDSYEYNSDTEQLESVTFRNETWSYDFSLRGSVLTLSRDGSSVTFSGIRDYSGDYIWVYTDRYLCKDAQALEDIDLINLCYSQERDSHWINLRLTDGSYVFRVCATMTPEGAFNLTYEDGDGMVHNIQMAYLYLDEEGIILMDGENIYRYTYDSYDRSYGSVETFVNLGNGQDVDDLEEEQVRAAMQKKDDLLSDLAAAFAENGISVTVDPVSGEIAMDTSILFGGDSAELTDEGRALLDQFLQVYTSVVYNDKYNGFVTATIVEGHTAPLASSTYESGLPLSEERAAVVMEYCLSGDTGIDPSVTASLAEIMTSVGCSNLFPVRNPDNSVNMEASRRVCFRFLVDITMAD